MENTDASLLARLAEIQARVEKATEGPWTAQRYDGYTSEPQEYLVRYPSGDDVSVLMQPDADFIAHAREDIPYLLAALRRSGEALRRLQEENHKLATENITVAAKLHQMRRSEADNHHNAVTCPYCNPLGLKFESPIARQSGAEGTEAGGRSHPLAPIIEEWQPIATAPKDEKLWFWIVPKTAEETYCNGSGQPILSTHEPYLHTGKHGTWGALSKATHWMHVWPLPAPPVSDAERATRSNVSAGSPPNLSTNGDRS